jgi:DNA repair exonuclease SbcCD ATPase subunit
MNELLTNAPNASWEEIAPHLDAALGELSDPDRQLVLLRYFQKKSAAEMATALGISDEAAQKRVSRAVEKLRELFSRRKITVSVGGLGILISANAVQSAPVGLTAAIATAVLAGAPISTVTVLATATKTIAMTTLQKALVSVTIAALAGAGIYKARQAAQLRDQVQALQQEQAPLEQQLQELQQQRDKAASELAALQSQHDHLRRDGSEILKLRGEVTQLRADANNPSLDQAKLLANQLQASSPNTHDVAIFLAHLGRMDEA